MIKRLKRNLHYLISVVGILLILICFVANPGTVTDKSYDVLMPEETEKNPDGSEAFTFLLDATEKIQKDLVFFTSHQFVEAYADGEKVYENTGNGGIWGHTTGSVWNFVQIPYGTDTVRVELVPAYENVAYQECSFYIGRELDIFNAIFNESLLAFFASALIIILGVGMIIYWGIVRKKAMIGKSLLHLGIFSVIFGLWSANETETMTLVLNNRNASSFMAYILLMMLGIPFALFVHDFLRIGDKKIWKILCAVSGIEFFSVLFLQFADIYDMKETLFLTHIILFIALGYMVGCLIYKVVRRQVDRRVKISLASMFLILVAAVTDISMYYKHIGDSDLFGRFVFLIFIITLGYEAAFYAVSIIEKGRQAKAYEELAIHDILTGLYNRTAYIADTTGTNSAAKTMVVSFDLNNLKECNDNHGHAAGDTYLKNAAQILEKSFGKYGKLYRMGGDEFCCVIEKADKCPIELCMEELRAEEEQYNEQRENYPIHIACGYAVYDKQKDSDFEAARNRSDAMMYENKSAIKEKMHIKDGRR